MKLVRESAQEVCNLVARELQVGVSLMVEDGKVLASSNQERINSTYDIAVSIMAKEINERTVTAEEVAEGGGLYEGYNIALDYGGQCVACLGIDAPLDVATRFVHAARHWILSHLESAYSEQIYDDMLQGQIRAHTADIEAELTERKRAEVALRDSQKTLRTVIDNISQGITLFDADMKLVAWNGRFLELLDFPEKMARGGVELADFLRFNAERGEYGAGDIEEQVASRVEKARLKEPHMFERVRQDGSALEIRGTPTPDGGFVTTYADITERKQAETAVLESESQLRGITDSVADGIITAVGSGLIETLNHAAERLFGYEVSELHGQNMTILMAEPYRTKYDSNLQAYGEAAQSLFVDAGTHEIVALRKDGTDFPVDLTVSEMSLSDQNAFVWVMRDITKRKKADKDKEDLEANLRQAQKLEALGTLAGGVAHEINTPVQYVGDNIRFLQESFGGFITVLDKCLILASTAKSAGQFAEQIVALEEAMEAADLKFQLDEVPSSLGQSLDGIDRIREIVLAIKEFSHPDVKEMSAVDLNHAIETTITVSRNQWKYVADLRTDFDDSLPPVPCLPGEFNQVMLNLIVNAAHAIEAAEKGGQGAITVATRAINNWAEIRVSDTGTGIKPENLQRVFDMFFTTKPPGKGTGQGLAICHTIVTQKHSGTLNVESEEGVGTTFIVRLPIAIANAAQVAAE